jgi:hypothetical protein
LHVGRLGEEMRLMRDYDAEAPIAVFECGEGASSGLIAGELGEVREEEAGRGV